MIATTNVNATEVKHDFDEGINLDTSESNENSTDSCNSSLSNSYCDKIKDKIIVSNEVLDPKASGLNNNCDSSNEREEEENEKSIKKMNLYYNVKFSFFSIFLILIIVKTVITCSVILYTLGIFGLGNSYYERSVTKYILKDDSNLLRYFPTSYNVFVSRNLLSSENQRYHKSKILSSSSSSSSSSSRSSSTIRGTNKIDTIMNNNIIPVFFNAKGSESDFIPHILSKCYHLKKQLIFDYSKTDKFTSTLHPDYIYTNSLYEVSKQLHIDNKKGRIYMILQNPSIVSMLSNNQKNVQENVNNNNNNTLIKSILYKNNNEDYEVTNDDYRIAQRYIDNYIVYDLFQEYQSILNTLFQEFNFFPSSTLSFDGSTISTAAGLSSDSFQRNCVKQIFLKNVDNMNRITIDKHLDKNKKDFNAYDSRLYLHALRKVYSDIQV